MDNRKLLLNQATNDAYFGIIYTLDTRHDWPELEERPEGEPLKENVLYEDDWRDAACWIKANPNLGVSKKYDYLQEQVQEALDKAGAQNSIQRLDFDIWTKSAVRWISPVKWADCGRSPIVETELIGRACYGGLDLSSSMDITALVLAFPPERSGEPYKILPRFWIPKDNMLARIRKDKVPYDLWWEAGLLTATPGSSIDYDYILTELDELRKRFEIKEIAFDRWGATMIAQKLQEMGGDEWVVAFGQGYGSMSPPSKSLETMIPARAIAHGNHPILTWMADNVVIETNAAGDIKPSKDRSTEKIDGMVAMVMALDRALRQEGPKRVDVYQRRGPIFLGAG